jgi:tetratricopeptide (TPR) repeat protein
MKNNPPLLPLLLFSSLLLTPFRALAQTDSQASRAKNQALRSLYDRAREQSASGNLEEALQLYKQAYELQPDPRLLFNVARIYHRQNRCDEAMTAYQQFIDVTEPQSEQRNKALDLQKQCQSYLDEQRKPKQSVIPIPTTAQEVEPPPAANQIEKRPLYTKWWLWLTIGSVAAAGITTGVVLGRRDPEPPMAERIEPSNTLHFIF